MRQDNLLLLRLLLLAITQVSPSLTVPTGPGTPTHRSHTRPTTIIHRDDNRAPLLTVDLARVARLDYSN